MTILDKYISQKFLGTLAFALIAFSAIYIVVDMIGYLDKFIDQDVPLHLIIKYYAYYLPYIIVLALPVAMLLASLFSVGQMSRYNEVVAMSAAGISLFRILLPLFLIGLIISAGTLYIGERLVPYTNQKKLDIFTNYMDKARNHNVSRNKDIYLQITKNQWLNIGYFDSNINTGYKISIEYFDDSYNKIVRRIDAPRMVWDGTSWAILNGYIRTFKGENEEVELFERIERPDFKFRPNDLSKVQKKAEEMSYWELRRFIGNIKRNGGDPNRWLVDLYLKIAFPFANFIIVLFGAPLSSRKTRSGPAISFGISLLICFLYFGIIKTGQALGHNGTLTPMLAAWIGNIIFGTAAAFIFVKMSK
ncbi:LptF/LptG family permease [candidate division KSB1 bacterium]|nr:LptF/LptG family permease [candidate division KSB1 bacterium]